MKSLFFAILFAGGIIQATVSSSEPVSQATFRLGCNKKNRGIRNMWGAGKAKLLPVTYSNDFNNPNFTGPEFEPGGRYHFLTEYPTITFHSNAHGSYSIPQGMRPSKIDVQHVIDQCGGQVERDPRVDYKGIDHLEVTYHFPNTNAHPETRCDYVHHHPTHLYDAHGYAYEYTQPLERCSTFVRSNAQTQTKSVYITDSGRWGTVN